MVRYRLDPNNPRRLTPEEAQRLEATPIDYSDIPPLNEGFFLKGRTMTDDDDFSAAKEPTTEDELYYIILSFVQDECGYGKPDKLDSWGLFERAFEALEKAGYIEIIDRLTGLGPHSRARITELGRNFEAWMKLDDRHKREEREAWELSETTPVPPEGPTDTMKHRHLVSKEFTPAAIEDILDRGKVRDWVPLIQAIRADPFGEIAEETARLVCERDLYAAPVFRRVILRARQEYGDEP